MNQMILFLPTGGVFLRLICILSDLIIPLMIFYIVGFGLLMRTDLYGSFLRGARDGLRTVVSILPTLIGLMVAVGVLRSSGFLTFLGDQLGRVLTPIGIPASLVPLSIVRLFSSSAATGLLLDLYKEFGTDSFPGLAGSILMSCTETVFYTLSVYFAAAKVTRTRYALPGALLATAAGLAASIWLAGIAAGP